MTAAEQQLRDLLITRSLKLAPPGQPFKLASGDTSNYYIDGKMTFLSSLGTKLVGEVLYERTRDLGIVGIGGLEVGAVPLMAAAVYTYQLHGRGIEGFIVRDHAKSHGTKKLVEGDLKAGDRVVVVDDVVTRGESAAKAIRALVEHGCQVVQVITIVDRLCGAETLFRELGVRDYRPVFTIEDLGVKVRS